MCIRDRYNGLDTEEFSPIKESVRDLNRLITTASADVPLKGLDYSLKALKILKKDNPNIHLIVIGSPKKGGHTERLIKELNILNKDKKEVQKTIMSFCENYEKLCQKKYPEAPLPLEILKSVN